MLLAIEIDRRNKFMILVVSDMNTPCMMRETIVDGDMTRLELRELVRSSYIVF
jgi:hypothetical protein